MSLKAESWHVYFSLCLSLWCFRLWKDRRCIREDLLSWPGGCPANIYQSAPVYQILQQSSQVSLSKLIWSCLMIQCAMLCLLCCKSCHLLPVAFFVAHEIRYTLLFMDNLTSNGMKVAQFILFLLFTPSHRWQICVTY